MEVAAKLEVGERRARNERLLHEEKVFHGNEWGAHALAPVGLKSLVSQRRLITSCEAGRLLAEFESTVAQWVESCIEVIVLALVVDGSESRWLAYFHDKTKFLQRLTELPSSTPVMVLDGRRDPTCADDPQVITALDSTRDGEEWQIVGDLYREPATVEEHLRVALIQNRVSEVQELIEDGADVNWICPSGFPLIGYVSTERVLRYFMGAGADIDIQDLHGRTELHHAARDNLDRVRLLLQYGADPNARANDGQTPLHLAGSIEIVKTLIASGANVNLQDEEGWTPLHGAVLATRYEEVQTLIEAGAELELADNEGITALMFAAGEPGPDYSKLVELLLQSGANPIATHRGNNS